MEFLALLRQLWRLRVAMAVGFVAAIGAAIAVGGPPPASSAIGWTRVTLDLPKSQLVVAAPKTADSLPWRTLLIADLMLTDEARSQIAGRLGVPADQVNVIVPSLEDPEVEASLPQAAARAAAVNFAPNVLTVSMLDEALPVLAVEAAAPDAEQARKLVEAGVSVLESQSSQGGRYTSVITTGEALGVLEKFDVRRVAEVRVGTVTTRSVPTKAIAAAVLVFGVCLLVGLAVPWLRRRLRPRPPVEDPQLAMRS